MSEEQHHHLALPQGTRIRDFEFHRVLGHGGFGITYLGWNVTLDIPVAIKEYLPTDLAARKGDQSVVPQSSQVVSDFQWGLERFLDEARTLARLQHPNIVRVHQYFEAHGTAYIAMDYVEGEDLSAYLARKGTLQEAELKGILYPLLDALEVVHGADFLHRDIKPGNIVLRDVDGSPVLLDFGAARQAIGAKSRSVTSIVTPGYAPIEQYSSRGRQGAWTDIYALGGVCYRALTGQVPDDATDRMRQDPLVPVAQRCAGQASRGFLSAIDVALSVDEGDRPQSVAAWREAMGTDTAEAQELAVDTAEAQKDAPPSKRQEKTKFKLLAVVLSVVVLLVVVGKMYVDHAEKQRQEQAFVSEVGRMPHPKGMNKSKTDLHITAELNLPVLTISLLDQGADIHAKDDVGGTPLHWAAFKDASEVAEVLLKQGADIHAKANDGDTPLHWAAEKDTSATVELLLNQGADIHAKNKYGNTPLHKAASGDASLTAEVLLKGGADIHAKDSDGHTPLHVAAYGDASAAAEVLLKGGADANAKDKYGHTPLHVAVLLKASAAAEVLLKGGADANAKDNNGYTPLHQAAYGDASAAAEVLLKGGADANAKNNNGYTPLHQAAYGDASAAAEVLLKGGADANAKDKYGNTPLHVAVLLKASAAAEVLLKGGADANAKNNNGYTPLHQAAEKDASAAAEVLLKGGADANAKNNNGYTPLHYAEQKNAYATADVLRRYGGRK